MNIMTMEPIPEEEMKIKEEKEKKDVAYDKEYRDALAKKLGFKSSEEYEKYKYEKRKEKLEKIEERVAKAEIEDETTKIKRERAEIKAEMVKIAIAKYKIAKYKIGKEKAIIRTTAGKIVTDIRTRKSRGLPTNVTIYDLPVSMQETSIAKSPLFIDNLIIGLRKEHNNLQKKINNCDLNTLKDICELGKLIDLHSKELQGIPSFELLLKDHNNTQKSFIKTCKNELKKTEQ